MRIKKCFRLSVMTSGLILLIAGRLTAQSFTNLYFFTATLTNEDGAQPAGGLTSSGGILYGTAGRGGTNGNGTLFAISTDGTGFTNLHHFSGVAANRLGFATNSEGNGPTGGLILSGNSLYGTAYGGGTNGQGTIFAISTRGAGFTNLHNFSAGATDAAGHFTNSDGATPYMGLILSGSTLYGTACYGGANGNGTVFAVNLNGTGFTNLHTFTTLVSSNNSDGANPYAGLLLSGNTLFGTTQFGGTNGHGTLFALSATGTGFTNLHNFSAGRTNAMNVFTNRDGANTRARLILSGNTLYGTATFGGLNGNGTLFAIGTSGTGFTNLHNFAAAALNAVFELTNYDGAYPQGGVILSGNTLFGTAEYAGNQGLGTLYSINTSGGSFTVLKDFPAENFSFDFLTETNSNGAYPQSALLLSGGVLYGTAPLGARYGTGTIFSLSVGAEVSAPPLGITQSGTNVLVTWPTSFAGFTLQSTTNLDSPVVWGSVSPAPVVINGQYVVTNSHSATRLFYRLSQ